MSCPGREAGLVDVSIKMEQKCITCPEFLSAFSFAPIYLFQSLFKCLLVPYLRVTLNASDWQIVIVLTSGLVPKLIMEQLVGCSVLSRFKRDIYVIHMMTGACLILWVVSSLVFAFLPAITESLEESDSSLFTIGVAALCHGLMSCASSIYSGLLPFFVPKSSWNSWIVYFSMAFLGTGVAIGILWIPVDPLANMNLIIGVATVATLIFFVFSQVGLCLTTREKIPYTSEMKEKKPTPWEKCSDFGDGLLKGFGNGMWVLWLFTLISGVFFGSFMYFATEWFVINGTVSESSTFILNGTIVNSTYSIFSSIPNFSYLSAVQILGNVGLLWIAMSCMQAICEQRGNNQNRAICILWFWMIFGSVFSTAGFIILIFLPDQGWIQSIAFALLGLYSVSDLGPNLLYYSSLKRYLFAGRFKRETHFIKSQFLMFHPIQLFGQAIGVILMPVGINYFGYIEFFKICSLMAALGWCVLLWIPFSFLFELMKTKDSRMSYQNLSSTPRENVTGHATHYTSKPMVLLKSVKSV